MSRLLSPRGPSLIVPRRHAHPMAPAAIVDATQEWARKSGRTCTWRWSAEMRCWTINLSMPSNAPIMRDYQEGRLQRAEPPTEGIPLMEQDEAGKWKALDLEQYGPTGIVHMLEEADLWSGRGSHNSLIDFINRVTARNRARREKMREEQRSWVRDLAVDVYRRVKKVPYLRVGIDLADQGER